MQRCARPLPSFQSELCWGRPTLSNSSSWPCWRSRGLSWMNGSSILCWRWAIPMCKSKSKCLLSYARRQVSLYNQKSSCSLPWMLFYKETLSKRNIKDHDLKLFYKYIYIYIAYTYTHPHRHTCMCVYLCAWTGVRQQREASYMLSLVWGYSLEVPHFIRLYLLPEG